MKTFTTILLLLIGFAKAIAADPIAEANKCWDEKNYQCMVDNYRQALTNRQYQEKDYSTIQYRMGVGYNKLERFSEAISALRESIRTSGNYGKAHWELAWAFYSFKMYDSAAAQYKRTIGYYTENSSLKSLYYWQAKSLAAGKKFKEAITAYKESYRLDSSDLYTASSLGDACYNNYEYANAVYYYSRAISLCKEENKKSMTSLYYWRGKASFNAYKYSESLKDMEQVLQLDPGYKEAVWQIAAAYYNLSEWKKSAEQYTKTIALYQGDKESLKDLYSYRADCYVKLNDYTKAMSDYDASLAIKPDNSWVLQGKAKLLEEQKKYKESIAIYTDLLKADTGMYNQAMNYYKRARIYLRLKDTAKALADINSSLNKDRYLGEPNILMADICFGQGKYMNAANYYSEALEDFTFYPDSTEMRVIYLRKGLSNWWSGSRYTALEDLKSCLLYDPNNKTARRYLGEIYYGNKDFTKALEEFTKCVSLYKNEKDSLHKVYSYRGLTQIELRNYTAAIADYEEALKIKPAETGYLYKAGQLYFEVKEYNKAIAVFNKLLPLLKATEKNDLAIVYYCRGRCQYELNKKEEAKKDFTKALEYVPSYTECQQWLDKVK